MAQGASQAPGARAEVRIRPPRRWDGFGLRELWGHRELVYFLTKRELQIRYKQTSFGVAWAVLQPLALGFVLALFLGRVARVPSDGIPYPVFAVAGVVPWLFTAQAVTQGAGSLLSDANLISKVYFPRLAIPLARALGLMLDLAIAVPVVLLVILIYGVGIGDKVYLVPLFLLLGVVTAFAAASLLATINVKYRDVALAIPMLVYLWLFMTPVMYPGTLITGGWEYIYALNPMSTVLNGVRWALLDATPPDPATVAISVGAVLVLVTISLTHFRRSERFFADYI